MNLSSIAGVGLGLEALEAVAATAVTAALGAWVLSNWSWSEGVDYYHFLDE